MAKDVLQIAVSDFEKLNRLKSDVLAMLNAIQVGRITAYFEETNTVNVEVMVRREVLATGALAEYPPLVDLPLIWQGAGDGDLTFPDPTGSECLILFADRSIDKWFETGQAHKPNSPRMHNLSDGFALLRPRSKLNPLKDYDKEATTLKKGDSYIKLKDDEVILTNGNSAIRLVGGQIFLEGAVIGNSTAEFAGTVTAKDFIANLITFLTHLHGNGNLGADTTPPKAG